MEDLDDRDAQIRLVRFIAEIVPRNGRHVVKNWLRRFIAFHISQNSGIAFQNFQIVCRCIVTSLL